MIVVDDFFASLAIGNVEIFGTNLLANKPIRGSLFSSDFTETGSVVQWQSMQRHHTLCWWKCATIAVQNSLGIKPLGSKQMIVCEDGQSWTFHDTFANLVKSGFNKAVFLSLFYW